jgi:hypothetical protein
VAESPVATADPDEPDDFDEMPAPAPSSSNVDEAMRLLIWARINKFAIPTLRIGDVVMTVEDLRPRGVGQPMTRDRGIWAENGVTDKDLKGLEE